MAQNSNWATIEGGVTNTFPLSINRETYWTALRKGECDFQDMTTRDYRGVFSYGRKPDPSPEFFIKDFAYKEFIQDTAKQTEAVFHWGRWWRINPDVKYRLEFSALDLNEPSFRPIPTEQELIDINLYINFYNRWQYDLAQGLADLPVVQQPYLVWVITPANAVSIVSRETYNEGAKEGIYRLYVGDPPDLSPAWESWTQSIWYSGRASPTSPAGSGLAVNYWSLDELRARQNKKAKEYYEEYVLPYEEKVLGKFSSLFKKTQKTITLNYTKTYYELSLIPASLLDGGHIDFINDSYEPIRLIAFNGVGQVFLLKETCGYVMSNAHFGPSEWRRTTPNYSIGTEYEGSAVTNALIDGAVAVAFRDRTQPGSVPRHYLWNGQDFGLELTGDVRKLSDLNTTYAEVNWPSRLIIFGPLVYELDEKRIFYYSGKTTASMVSRPYFAANFNAQTLRRIAFICDGNSGSFEATVEYGQAFQNLQKTRSFKVKVNNNTKNRFRHLWLLDIPVTCRVWRLKIDKMTGIGITQIDADVSFVDSPDLPDGTE